MEITGLSCSCSETPEVLEFCQQQTITNHPKIPPSVPKYHKLTQNIHKYPQMPQNIHKYHKVSTNIYKYHKVSTNIHKYLQISQINTKYPSNITEYPQISPNATKYPQIPTNITKYPQNMPQISQSGVWNCGVGGGRTPQPHPSPVCDPAEIKTNKANPKRFQQPCRDQNQNQPKTFPESLLLLLWGGL